DALAELHATTDDQAADRPVRRLTQQQPDLGDVAERIDAYRHGLDVDDRYLGANQLELLGRQPGRVGVRVDEAHGTAIISDRPPGATNTGRAARVTPPAGIRPGSIAPAQTLYGATHDTTAASHDDDAGNAVVTEAAVTDAAAERMERS